VIRLQLGLVKAKFAVLKVTPKRLTLRVRLTHWQAVPACMSTPYSPARTPNDSTTAGTTTPWIVYSERLYYSGYHDTLDRIRREAREAESSL
jgi:hypothetical protein